jgi:beta-galactosidase
LDKQSGRIRQSAERVPYSGAREVKAVYRNVKARLEDERTVVIENLHDFISLENVALLWELEKDGAILASGTVDTILCPPHQSTRHKLPYEIPSQCKWGCHLNLSFVLKKDTTWAQKGYEIAFEQIEFPIKREREIASCTTTLAFDSSAEYFNIRGEGFEYRFNRYYGGWERLDTAGVSILKSRTAFGIWRAFGGTDGMIKSKWVMTEDSSWNKSENFDKVQTRVYSSEIKKEGADVVISVRQSLSPISKMPLIHMEAEYRIFPNGEIAVTTYNRVREDAAFLPRFGFEAELNGNMEHMQYYGNGPEENYPDVCHHVRKGFFETKTDGDYVEKAFPQEQGNHTGTEFLKIYDERGGIIFTSDGELPFCFRATHHSIEEINGARHYCELKKRDTTYLRVDYKVSGVGSYALQDKYKLLEKDFVFRFRMKPFAKG